MQEKHRIPVTILKMAAKKSAWKIFVATTKNLMTKPTMKNPITILKSVKTRKLGLKLKINPKKRQMQQQVAKVQICTKLMGGQPEKPREPRKRMHHMALSKVKMITQMNTGMKMKTSTTFRLQTIPR